MKQEKREGGGAKKRVNQGAKLVPVPGHLPLKENGGGKRGVGVEENGGREWGDCE